MIIYVLLIVLYIFLLKKFGKFRLNDVRMNLVWVWSWSCYVVMIGFVYFVYVMKNLRSKLREGFFYLLIGFCVMKFIFFFFVLLLIVCLKFFNICIFLKFCCVWCFVIFLIIVVYDLLEKVFVVLKYCIRLIEFWS